MIWAIDESEEKVREAVTEIRRMTHPANKAFGFKVVLYDGFISKEAQQELACLSADTESGVRFRFDTWGMYGYRRKFRNIEKLERFLLKAVRARDATKKEIDHRVAKYQAKVAKKWERTFDGLRS